LARGREIRGKGTSGAAWLSWSLCAVSLALAAAGLLLLVLSREALPGAPVFEVSVVALQHVMLVLTHVEDSEFAYFATAMLMAALFDPLKRRIDALVERRFFRWNNRAGR
jgi:hypothetical protein